MFSYFNFLSFPFFLNSAFFFLFTEHDEFKVPFLLPETQGSDSAKKCAGKIFPSKHTSLLPLCVNFPSNPFELFRLVLQWMNWSLFTLGEMVVNPKPLFALFSFPTETKEKKLDPDFFGDSSRKRIWEFYFFYFVKREVLTENYFWPSSHIRVFLEYSYAYLSSVVSRSEVLTSIMH